ncbi:MAG: zinc-binding dehydrogenase [Chloroflexi bacterium]|nr:zinc-binding dehydrogenase [Chloroflexota bacterium]
MKCKRVIISRYGGSEALQVVEGEIPKPRVGEARVRILAAGVAWGDILNREGFGRARPPFTPGYDIVGVVDQLGEGVSTITVGQMVAALPVVGGYAERICLPASELTPVPTGLDPAEAVSLVMNYVAAHQMLHRAARVRRGERVLIHNAAGGVGTALLQLGKLAELEMYGTASRGKHELVANLGATPIDKEGFAERLSALASDGVDAVFDPVGGTRLWQSYRTLQKGGRLVVYGAHSVVTEGMPKMILGFMLSSALNLLPDGRTVLNYSVTPPPYSKPAWCREDLSMLFDLLAQEKIKPVVAERMPLEEAGRAHDLLGKGAVAGKIVITPTPAN